MFATTLCTLFFLQAPNAMTKQIEKEALQRTEEASAVTKEGSRSVLLISPKDRAADYIQAFQMLSRDKSKINVSFMIKGHSPITNVIDISALPGGTLLYFRYSTPEGMRYQVVPIEDIEGISHG